MWMFFKTVHDRIKEIDSEQELASIMLYGDEENGSDDWACGYYPFRADERYPHDVDRMLKGLRETLPDIEFRMDEADRIVE